MEIWKDVVDREGEYEVSNFGNVRSIERVVRQKSRGGNEYSRTMKSKTISPYLDGNGRYLYVHLGGSKGIAAAAVHRLVALAFVPNPDNKPEVRHLDGTKRNNISSNLEWGTRQENEDDKELHGTRVRGEQCGASKISDKTAKMIKKMVNEKIKIKKYGAIASVAREFGVSNYIVGQIARGEYWRHV